MYWWQPDLTLRRISVRGGASVTLATIDVPYGMPWHDRSFVIGQGPKGIVRVPEGGGPPETLVEVASGEFAHGPQILPGGSHVLYTLARGLAVDRWNRAQIVVEDIASRERKTLIDGGSDARCVHLGNSCMRSAAS